MGLDEEQYRELKLSWVRAGTAMDLSVWQKVLDWRAEGSPGDLATWVWRKEEGSESFQTWLTAKLKPDYDRWISQGFKKAGMSFESYRKQQGLFWLGPERELISLNPSERLYYKVTVQDGRLTGQATLQYRP